MQILNGRHEGDLCGNFTHYNKNKGASQVDVAVISDNFSQEIKHFFVLPQNELSDHCKIVTHINNIKTPTRENPKYDWKQIPSGYKWGENDMQNYKLAFNDPVVKKEIQLCKQLLEAGLIESTGKKIQDIFILSADCALNKHREKTKIQAREPRKKNARKKWFDKQCYEFKKETRAISKQKHNNPHNLNLINEYKNSLKAYKRLCGQKKLEFQKEEVGKLAASTSNPSLFWQTWKSMREEVKESAPSTENVDGHKWEFFFKELYSDTNRNLPNADTHNNDNPIFDEAFTIKDLSDSINDLKLDKASGLDNIKNEFIKAAPHSVQAIILDFINLMLRTTLAPKQWCLDLIVPIHKDGDKDNPDNYRGLCIMNTLLKLVCTMMSKRLQKFLTEEKVISPEQIGFKPKSRTSDHILTIKALVNKYVCDQKNSKLYTCFVDFKKAFDSVPQLLLYEQLNKKNINGKFLSLLKNIYRKTECAVKFGNYRTKFFKYAKGLRQGDPLSPLLFNIYINDIFEHINEANPNPVTLDEKYFFSTLGYADDLVIFSTTPEGLQKSIDSLQTFCEKRKIEINVKKTKCMTFTKGNQAEKQAFRLKNGPIENIRQFKYLGITISAKKCAFQQTVREQSNKAMKAIFALNSKINLTLLPVRLAIQFFDTAVMPILLYGSEIWEPYINEDEQKWDANEIEKIHTQFIKRILGLNRSTTNILARAEVGRFPLQTKILERNIKYMKYLGGKTDELVKQALTYELANSRHRVTIENSILKNLNAIFPFVTRHLSLLDIPDRELKKILHEINQTTWLRALNSSTKCDTYKQFKNRVKFEQYLTDVTQRKHRVAMCKLRTSDHNLMIEQGRRARPRLERIFRTCPTCIDPIENEYHFLTSCTMYNNRDAMFQNIARLYPLFAELDNENKFIFLCSQENKDINKILAANTYEWLKIRETLNLL